MTPTIRVITPKLSLSFGKQHIDDPSSYEYIEVMTLTRTRDIYKYLYPLLFTTIFLIPKPQELRASTIHLLVNYQLRYNSHHQFYPVLYRVSALSRSLKATRQLKALPSQRILQYLTRKHLALNKFRVHGIQETSSCRALYRQWPNE